MSPTSTPTPISTTTIRPPLTSVTPTNQTGIIAILTGFSLGLVLLSILVRLYIRRNASIQRCDNCAFYAATIFALAEISVTLWLVDGGLGKSVELLTVGEVEILERGVLAGTLLYILALGLSKVSCALIFVWLTPFKRQERAAWGLVGLSGVWVVSSLFTEGFGCRDLLGRCEGYTARWLYISIFDMLLEACLVGASVYMVWSRSMSAQAKYTVVGAFSSRLPNIAIMLIRLIFVYVSAPTSAIHIARIQAATQLGIGYTIVSCVVPYLRPLMQSYESDRMGLGSEEATFKLSDRSRGSKGSGSDEIGESKGKGRAMGMELNDVSRLLSPERPGFAMLKSKKNVVMTRAAAEGPMGPSGCEF